MADIAEIHLTCGSFIRRDTPRSTYVSITDRHVCGAHGYGVGADDHCPACDKDARLHRLLKRLETPETT